MTPPKAYTAKPSHARRDWRLAAVSACCSTLGCACLLLAACSGNTLRPSAEHAAQASEAIVAPAFAPALPAPAIAEVQTPPHAASEEPVTSPWQKLRSRYAMPGCDYSPMVQKFAASMAGSPRHLHAALKQAMPFLLIVTDQIEKFGMPGEFAFLPWVESSYTMLEARGDGAGGMWQLMPQTARESGLRVDSEYDGRLDVYASSRTALVLLKQYDEEFGDWRLANMAYNAGENSLKGALGARRSITPIEIARLRINQTNYEHLTKLLAMACIVSSPERFRVELPEPDEDDVPAVIELPAPVDLHLAAQIAGMDFAQLQHWNPAYLKARMPERGPYHLLVPATRRSVFERTLGMLPQYAWRDWRNMKLQQPQSIEMLGMAYDLDANALAAINGVEATATLPAGSHLLLPGHGINDAVAVAEPTPAAPAVPSSAAGRCTVHPGDTLWQIARRYNVRIDDLIQWNRLPRDATLRLGQELVVNSPDDSADHP